MKREGKDNANAVQVADADTDDAVRGHMQIPHQQFEHEI